MGRASRGKWDRRAKKLHSLRSETCLPAEDDAMTIAYEANGISVEMRTRSIAAHSRMSNVVTPGSAVYVEIHDVLRAAGREIEEIIEKKVPEKTL